MPLYEYACVACRNRFEKLRPAAQMDDAASCPDCGARGQRVLSVFAALSSGAGGEPVPVGGGGCCGGGGCGGCACSRG
ncbi:MAG: zinc ribbon domain-containing protein [Chloroflexi bacterium]|nr:zinc ribbon domain-containing protein [Chloroflexota bacterium]